MPVLSPMPPSAPPLRLRLLSGPLRACFLAALLMLPVVAVSAGDGISEMERELAVERTCEDWQKVHRCADAEGRLEYECVAKSPMARFLAFFSSDRPEDDEVRVIRKAPEPRTTVAEETGGTSESRSEDGSPSRERDGETGNGESGNSEDGSTRSPSPSTASSPAASEDADEIDGQYRQVRVKKVEKDLPRCRDSR